MTRLASSPAEPRPFAAMAHPGRRRCSAWVLVVGLLLVTGCRPGGDQGPDRQVLATYSGGEVTAQELDEKVASLPPDQRPRAGDDVTEWRLEMVRRIAVEEILLQRALEAGVEENPAFVADREQTRREIAADLCLQRLLPRQPPITEDELREIYRERRDDFVQPETRLVYHIFRRRADGQGDSAINDELLAIRQRVLDGESFSVLAGELSDSESRYKDGLIGSIGRGELTEELERLIFDLEERVPSRPWLTPEGGHLFFVERAIERKVFTFDEVREQLLGEVDAGRLNRAMAALQGEIEIPEGSFVLEGEQLQEAMSGPDREAVVLRFDDYELTAGGLRGMLRQLNDQEGGRQRRRVTAAELLDSLRAREKVLHRCQELGELPIEAISRRLSSSRDQALAGFQRRQEIRSIVDEEEPRLREFYERNIELFSSPPSWKISLLRVPVADISPAIFARLDEAKAGLDGGDLRLEDLATEVGATVNSLKPMPLARLARRAPEIGRFIAPLGAGEHTTAFRSGTSYVVARVEERSAGAPLGFEAARRDVRSAYLDHHRQRVNQILVDRVLAQAGFEVLPDRLRAVPDTEPGGVDLEQLEQLLDEETTTPTP